MSTDCCGVDTVSGSPAGSGGAVAELVDVRRLLPPGTAIASAAAPLNLGISNVSSGTHTYVAPSAGTSLLAATERSRWTGAAAAGTTAGHRNGSQIWNRDTFGGFTLRWVVHLQTLVNNLVLGYRSYVGLAAQTAVLPVVNPSTFVDIVGFGFDPAPAPQWSVMTNDAAGLATVTALGVDFIANTTDLVAFQISAIRGAADFTMHAENLTTGIVSPTFVVAANIPAAALLLSENVWLNSTADVTTAVTIDIAEIRAETALLAA